MAAASSRVSAEDLGGYGDRRAWLRDALRPEEGVFARLPNELSNFDLLNHRPYVRRMRWYVPDLESILADRDIGFLKDLSAARYAVDPLDRARAIRYSAREAKDDELLEALRDLPTPKLEKAPSANELTESQRATLNTLLHEAIEEGDVDMMNDMLFRGADPDYVEPSDGLTPLAKLASRPGMDERMLLSLVGYGAALDENNGAAIAAAIQACAPRNVELLLMLGANPRNRNNYSDVLRASCVHSNRKREAIRATLDAYDSRSRLARKRLARFLEPWVQYQLYKPGTPEQTEKPGIRVRQVASLARWQREPQSQETEHAAFEYAVRVMRLPSEYLRAKKIARDMGLRGNMTLNDARSHIAQHMGCTTDKVCQYLVM